ncbi:uncharacterized protein LOC120297276 isoform X3 [Crotalus tigris]|uniref:uncharacterized protein LOC120297276 isoform X3 n=1 Tax=Crotalus tigris TaxID=88082 RepID=UPI00192FB308|nr:uncharacterized protein LOC120297276 isoform X3 [Crotalus tigris]
MNQISVVPCAKMKLKIERWMDVEVSWGHHAVECHLKAPQRNPDQSLTRKSGKSPAKPQEPTMKVTETVKLPHSAGEGTPAYTTGAADTSDDNLEGKPWAKLLC